MGSRKAIIMTEDKRQYRFDSVDLILYLWNRKWPLIILTGIAAVISIIVSLTIEEKYKSEVIIFPTAATSISHDLLAVNIAKKEIMKLGEDEEVEQLLQVLNSDEIRARIIHKYDLMNHYDIDTAASYPLTVLNEEFAENFAFTPTKFMSVSIQVMDTDPAMAAAMANDIGNLVDTIMNGMQKERAQMALALVEHEYFSFKAHIIELQDSLKIISEKGIVDYESQSEVTNQAYAQAILDGNTRAEKKLQEKLDVLAKYGGAYMSLAYQLEFESEQLSKLKSKYAEAQLDATQNLPNKFVVNSAFVAEKKSYPVRWLIVVASTFSTFILALLLLVVFDSITRRLKEIQQKA